MELLTELNQLIETNSVLFLNKCFDNDLANLAFLACRKMNLLTRDSSTSYLSECGKLEFQRNNRYSAFNIYEEMVKKFSFLSHSELENVYENLDNIGLDKYDFYNPLIVKQITERTPSFTCNYVLSITTCKRLDLFTRTMNSFLNCCQDLDLIDRWICVDDNSTEQDRRKMKELYPFFHFIHKNETNKGHYKSMNIIRDYVIHNNAKYLFHMEDDFLFFVSLPYITRCTQIIENANTFGQCLLNRNYAETPDQWRIHGGFNCSLANGTRYVIHEHYPDHTESKEKEAFYSHCNENNLTSAAYWPHFSFRPSLIKVDVLRNIGEFRDAPHFEMEYAFRYVKDYQSVFFNMIVCKHIGKLTHEKDKSNAYSLNNQQQFSRYDIASHVKKYILFNLERRPDRLETFKRNNDSIISPSRYEIYPAFDGYKLSESYAMNRVFDYNNHHWRRTILGCALCHLLIWYELRDLNDEDIYIVFEDDIIIVSNFDERLKELSALLKGKDWDIVFLGHGNKKVTSRFTDEKIPLGIEKYSVKDSFERSFGGTYGYMVNGKGAKKLLALYNVVGIDQGIDTMMQKSCDHINTYYVDPHLVFTVHFAGDSDIQKGNFVGKDFLVPSVTSYLKCMEDHMAKNNLTVDIIPFDELKKIADQLSPDKDVTLLYSADKQVAESPNVHFYFFHNKCACIFKNDKHELLPFYKNRLPLKFQDLF